MSETPLTAFTRLWARVNETGMSAAQAFAGLSTLLFLKMCRHAGADWRALSSAPPEQALALYAHLQQQLGATDEPYLAAIFQQPDNAWQNPATLRATLAWIDQLNWIELRACGIGETFEYLAEIYATEHHAAWAALTPQSLASVIAGLLQIEPGETVLDPCAGNGALLSAAHAYRQALLYEEPATYLTRRFSTDNGLYAREKDPILRRLALMSLALHDVPYGAFDCPRLPAADVLISNALYEIDFNASEAAQCQTQWELWQQCLGQLKTTGRAALIVSDTALYHPTGREARRAFLEQGNLHTLVRLPDGLFHGRDVSAHVAFFTRSSSTRELWYYDLRTGLPWFDPQHAPFQAHYFNPLIEAYGDLADGSGRRKENDMRFRCFSRADLHAGEDNLDLCWLSEEDCDFPLFRPPRHAKVSPQTVRDTLSELKELSFLLNNAAL
jgi:type I restriction enzyme M protein